MTKCESRLSEKRVKHYLELAKNACIYSDSERTRVGCVVVYKGKVLSVGWNNEKTSPTQKKYNRYRGFDPDISGTVNSIHAELHAMSKIKDMDINWSKVYVFVYRIKKDDTKGMARPCPGCEKMLRDMGIRRVYYSTNNGYAYEVYD